MAVQNIGDAEFKQQVIESGKPVVVDFWAPWCGPCRMVGPVLETLSEEFGDEVTFVKVNVDDNRDFAAQLGVQGIPAIFFFKGGQVVNQVVGAQPEAALREAVRSSFGIGAQA